MTAKENKDEFDELFVEDRLDKKVVVDALKPYICFTSSGEIQYHKVYGNLSIPKKIVVQLLSNKVLVIKKIVEKEGVRRKELIETIGSKEHTFDGQLYGPLKGIVKSDKGVLVIPNYNIHKAKSILDGEEKDVQRKRTK